MILHVFKNRLVKFFWVLRNYRKLNTNLKYKSTHYLGPVTYDTDSLTTSNNCDFMHEPKFAEAYNAALNTNPWGGFTLQWRTYIVCWLANHVKSLEGDFVECGVNTGAYSIAVVKYIEFQKLQKTFYLFDTFNGLDINQITENEKMAGIEKYIGNYKDVYEEVKNTFKDYKVSVIKGLVPETLIHCTSKQICYLSIDMNVVEPEIAAFHYFWDKIVIGGVLILDDYGFPPHINQKIAFDKLAVEYNFSILSLPTGQGIIFKK